jgi:hypothetical protein
MQGDIDGDCSSTGDGVSDDGSDNKVSAEMCDLN